MKVLGRVYGYEFVLDRDDGYNALNLVDAIPDPTGETRYVITSSKVTEYKAGTILVSDGIGWKVVVAPDNKLGPIEGIVCPRIGTDVQIRWKDPDDKDTSFWNHTLLVRKYGENPRGPKDGVVVTKSSVHNQYREKAFHDILPAGTEDGWFYRFFVFNDDHVGYTSDACTFVPIELSWETLPSIVRDGNANRVYALGDTVTIRTNNEDYGDIEFEVVGFDTVSPEDANLTKSVTFAMVNPMKGAAKWDNPWPEYYITPDTYVTSRTKIYYINDNGTFMPITGLRLGSRIPANTYYERNQSEVRSRNGGNRWAKCGLRNWANSVSVDDKWSFGGNDVVPPMTVLPEEVVNAITPIRCITALPSADGVGYDSYVDRMYLLSITETLGMNAVRTWYTKTIDSVPSEYYGPTEDTVRDMSKTYFLSYNGSYILTTPDSFNEDGSFIDSLVYYELLPKKYYIRNDDGTFREAVESDFNDDNTFVSGTEYFDQNVSSVSENGYLRQFGDTELNPLIKETEDDGIVRSWWLRTANADTETSVKVIREDGTLVNSSHTATDLHHVVLAFSVA